VRLKVEWWVVGSGWWVVGGGWWVVGLVVRVSAPGAVPGVASSPPLLSQAGLSQYQGRESLYTQMVWFG
jgi:hypothetical protein